MDDYSWQITLEDGKEEDEEERGGGLQHIQKELLNLSESTVSSPERILIKLWTFVIHYLETTYIVLPLSEQTVLTPIPLEWARRRQETCNYAKRGLIIFPPGNGLARADTRDVS